MLAKDFGLSRRSQNHVGNYREVHIFLYSYCLDADRIPTLQYLEHTPGMTEALAGPLLFLLGATMRLHNKVAALDVKLLQVEEMSQTFE